MTVLVWAEAWQFECCGDPARVGELVIWEVADASGPCVDGLVCGEWDERVKLVEDHHGTSETRPITGVVRAIQALTAVIEGRAPGEARRVVEAHLDSADAMGFPAGSPQIDQRHEMLEGWIVELDVLPSAMSEQNRDDHSYAHVGRRPEDS